MIEPAQPTPPPVKQAAPKQITTTEPILTNKKGDGFVAFRFPAERMVKHNISKGEVRECFFTETNTGEPAVIFRKPPTHASVNAQSQVQ